MELNACLISDALSVLPPSELTFCVYNSILMLRLKTYWLLEFFFVV
uniref:Uncharacterized protein n=1 Tax=Arundo donax TaxID=35708 RepID=A0A0A9BTH7_ARUDO